MPKHMVIRFTFSGITKAYEFLDALTGLGVQGSIDRQNDEWHVKTDTRALEHAAKLMKAIYGTKEKK